MRKDSISTNQTIQLRDGRTLGYAEYGNAEGKVMFYFHGHPGSRLEARFLAEQAARAGIRLIGIDRPGMGLSRFKADRLVLDISSSFGRSNREMTEQRSENWRLDKRSPA